MKEDNLPKFVFRDGMISDKDYVAWLSEIKKRFQRSQIKAAVRVNSAMLEFYWSVGRDLVALHAEERWGEGVVKQFALDMRQAFPTAKGFSYSNVKYMKQWYLFYSERIINSQQAVGLLEDGVNGQQAVGHLEMPEIFSRIPWGHHIHIISKCQTLDESYFYINHVAAEGWSRSYLEDQMASQLFSRQGTAVTNFNETLPETQIEMAKKMLKDPYNFDFLTMKARYDEKDLEEALVANITRFLLELGKGFSYVGRQIELQMPDGQSFFPDLVFYNIPQHRYVIIELKAVKYAPEFAGKLNFYVTAADNLLRGEGDNPSVGLVICRSAEKTIVEWSLKDIQKPLGVATYQLQAVVDRTIAELEQQGKVKRENNEKEEANA